MSGMQTKNLALARAGRNLISGLDWQLAPGELWCVLGQNGVGKTTLLYALAGLLKPVSGQILLDGVALDSHSAHAMAHKRGLMAQQQVDAFSCSVRDAVLIGRTPYRIGRSWDSDEDLTVAAAALASVGLADKAEIDVQKLSGGERQRAALATLLAQAPEVMLLDEPTAHQDVAQQLAMMRLVRDLTRDHAVVVTCHDINLAARFATHALVLARARHWIGRVEDVLKTDVLEQAFGCGFSMVQAGDARSFVAY